MVTGAFSFGHSVPCDPFTVSGRSYTSKYRTVSSPLFLLHPVTPVCSIDVFSDIRPYRNKEMARLKAAIRTIAKNDSATLIYGETGTGKELFAEALHALSGRKDKPFLSQNCAARCMPLKQERVGDVCVCCGKPAKHMIYWGVAY